jgi:hypothetical protein
METQQRKLPDPRIDALQPSVTRPRLRPSQTSAARLVLASRRMKATLGREPIYYTIPCSSTMFRPRHEPLEREASLPKMPLPS